MKFLLSFFFGVILTTSSLVAAENRIVLIEQAKRLSESVIKKSAASESEKNPDGGYNADVSVVDCFADMEYRFYTGGRYQNKPIRFRLLLPDKIRSGKKYPLVVWFHGKGESGEDNTRQLAHVQSTIEFLAGKNKLDFFLLATQCPEDNPYWDGSVSQEGKGDAPITILDEILDAVCEEYPIDQKKLCIYGHCSGGNAAWQFADRYPNRFAAMIVCSSSPGTARAESFRNTVIWAFNNKDDTPPTFEQTGRLLDEINELGGIAMMTLRKTGGHDSWTNALSKEKVVAWMLTQSLDHGGPPPGFLYRHRSVLTRFLLFCLPIILTIGIVLLRLLHIPSVSEKKGEEV